MKKILFHPCFNDETDNYIRQFDRSFIINDGIRNQTQCTYDIDQEGTLKLQTL